MNTRVSAPYGEIEYLASLIRGKNSLKRAQQLARELIARFESLPKTLAASREILESIPGVGFEGARAICESNSLILSVIYKRIENQTLIRSSDELIRFLLWKLTPSPLEQLAVVYLNNRNQVIGYSVVATGTRTNIVVRPQTILSEVIKANATGFVLAHNHPAGDPQPSMEDFATTTELLRLAKQMSIKLLDHVIVADGRWYSFQQNGFFDRQRDDAIIIGADAE